MASIELNRPVLDVTLTSRHCQHVEASCDRKARGLFPWLRYRPVPTADGRLRRLTPRRAHACTGRPPTYNSILMPSITLNGINWLRVFHGAGASRIGHSSRSQRHTRGVRSEKCRGLRGTAWYKMQVIAGLFGSGALVALPVHGAA